MAEELLRSRHDKEPVLFEQRLYHLKMNFEESENFVLTLIDVFHFFSRATLHGNGLGDLVPNTTFNYLFLWTYIYYCEVN